MKTMRGNLAARIVADDRGQATVEYTLLLAVFGVPLLVLFAAMLAALSSYFEMVSLIETMPLP
jgi:Flp pilus assembly pilin Flp